MITFVLAVIAGGAVFLSIALYQELQTCKRSIVEWRHEIVRLSMLSDNLLEAVKRHRNLHPDLNAIARAWEELDQ